MSLFGKVLAVLNVVAALAFMALLAMDYGKRKQWNYAVFRHDLAMEGLPVDEEDRTVRGRQKYKDLDEEFLKNIPGGGLKSPEEATLQEELGRLDNRIKERFNQANPAEKVRLLCDLLIALARTGSDRVKWLDYKASGNLAYAEPLAVLEKEFKDARENKDLGGKRRAIGRILLHATEVLATPDEKTALAAEMAKRPEERDLTTIPPYKRLLVFLGVRGLAQELEEQAALNTRLTAEVRKILQHQRQTYIARYNSLLQLLQVKHHEWQQLDDLLRLAEIQALEEERQAGEQKRLVDGLTANLEAARNDTDRELQTLKQRQEELFAERKKLRDTIAGLQEKEALIRKYEAQLSSKEQKP